MRQMQLCGLTIEVAGIGCCVGSSCRRSATLGEHFLLPCRRLIFQFHQSLYELVDGFLLSAIRLLNRLFLFVDGLLLILDDSGH